MSHVTRSSLKIKTLQLREHECLLRMGIVRAPPDLPLQLLVSG